ncbi:pyridoxal phosphate-dependent decarboxylase family protein [Gillisia marina]|uniref:pyridoxal phosphate-dependent decarboxylase family protein n=1 Tax=Gillisia marina TaxID=1167637 RepID=UPI00029B018C|nr:aminotransferase class V-fold PLP-dependent enzyme [Gillisia marina]
MENTIQKAMFSEMKDKDLFKKSQKYAFDYMDKVMDRNVFPSEEALENLMHFEESLSENSTDGSKIIEMLHAYGSPATIAQLGGRYFGFVNGGAVPAGLAAKNLSMFWDQNTALQVLSPIASKIEVIVEKWLIDLFKLPERSAVGFVSGTSMATFCGLAAARYRLLKNLDWDINEKGLFEAPKLRIITSKQAHSTVVKAVGLLGFGKENIEWVPVDSQGRIIPDEIPKLDSSSILLLQAGNVNSGAFEDFKTICAMAKEVGAWVHIDGAFGLWAEAVKDLKYLTLDMQHANSWAVDGHKTLNTPYDSGIIMCEDREALIAALHMTGEYIIQGDERDGMYFTPEMSKRARVIELWATLKYLGKKGIDEMIWGLHKHAVNFSKKIGSVPGFKVLNEVVFNQVIVQCETDELTNKTITRIQKLNDCWVGGSMWNEKKIIRVSICSWATTEEDIRIAVNSFQKALSEVRENVS